MPAGKFQHSHQGVLTPFHASKHSNFDAVWSGPTVSVGDQQFYVRPEPKAPFTLQDDAGNPRPATILTLESKGPLNANDISAILQRFQTDDDVYSPYFMSNVILQRHPSLQWELDLSASAWLNERGIVHVLEAANLLPEGPYFLANNSIFEAWKLYPDTTDAFFVALQPDHKGGAGYSLLELPGTFAPRLAIAVPSRLYFKPSTSKPLNGLRMAVKDIFDIKGIRTGASNKAYLDFFPPAKLTAPSVQRLIDLGVIVVGKTKCTSFADREYPPSDWIDYHCPFNPRGDGYLLPEGSSTGSAAAVAAYNWLDFSIGTDTSASLRMPAAAQGIFGLRPSHGATSMEGVIPLVKNFDTVGMMARDIRVMQRVSRFLYDHRNEESDTKYPKTFYYCSDWSDDESLPPVKAVFDAFVEKLESFLELKKIDVDIEEAWTQQDPMKTGKSFEEEFLRTYERIHGPATLEFQSKWSKEFAEKHGYAPYLPPALKNRWPYVKTITEEETEEAYAQVEAYKKWFWREFLHSEGSDPSNAIMVDRWTWKLGYRDVLRESPNAGRDYGFSQEFSPSFAELPELVICIGQYEYLSEISKRKEYAPVAASLIGAKGSEHMLMKLAEEFLNFAGIPGKVLTGKTPFPAKEYRLPPDWHL